MKNKISCFIVLFFIIMPLFSQEASSAEEASFDESKILMDSTNDAANQEVNNNGNEKILTAWDFIKVILVLAVVILIVYGIFFFLRKAGGSKYQSNNLIKLLGTQALTPNCTLHLVEAGEKYYLVGCSDNSVSHIANIEDKESIDSILLNTPEEVSEKKGFSELLGRYLGKNSNENTGIVKKMEKNQKNVIEQAERLKKM